MLHNQSDGEFILATTSIMADLFTDELRRWHSLPKTSLALHEF